MVALVSMMLPVAVSAYAVYVNDMKQLLEGHTSLYLIINIFRSTEQLEEQPMRVNQQVF